MQPSHSSSTMPAWPSFRPRREARSWAVAAAAALPLVVAGCGDDLGDGAQGAQARSLVEVDGECASGSPREEIGGGKESITDAGLMDAAVDMDAGLADGGTHTDEDAGQDAGDDEIARAVRLRKVDPFGCGIAPVVTENGQDFEISFEGLSVEGTKVHDWLTCFIDFELEGPRDREVAVESFEATGALSLAAGATGDFQLAAYTHGRSGDSQRQAFKGPHEGPVSYRVAYPPEALSFSICNYSQPARLRLNLSLTTDGKTPGSIRLNKLGKFRFATRPCVRKP